MANKTEERSTKKITQQDLKRLARIAYEDRKDLFKRKTETGTLYKDKLLCVALCQGAALHYLDGKNEIKDFDVWSFYKEHPKRPFPYRRNVKKDFGLPKFGKTRGAESFIGRKVDLLGRSIPYRKGQTAIKAVQDYVAYSKGLSPKYLRQKAIIILFPEDQLGKVIWPIKH
ncbi:MAG: hypothetical protein GY853_06070 [PVC group bacterium]|nr:hypothetical protein [PVC group bacterium]